MSRCGMSSNYYSSSQIKPLQVVTGSMFLRNWTGCCRELNVGLCPVLVIFRSRWLVDYSKSTVINFMYGYCNVLFEFEKIFIDFEKYISMYFSKSIKSLLKSFALSSFVLVFRKSIKSYLVGLHRYFAFLPRFVIDKICK